MFSSRASAIVKELTTHYNTINQTHMRALFQEDPERALRFSVQGPHIFLDYSKNRISAESLNLLLKLTESLELRKQIEALFSGEHINNTEDRPALHSALRMGPDQTLLVDGVNIVEEVHQTRRRMAEFVEQIHSGKVTGYSGKSINTLISIGIGGSYLGPKTVTEALKPFAIPGLSVEYIANIDGADLSEVLAAIDPERSLFLIQSKSFSTLETLENAHGVVDWLQNRGLSENDISKHLLAVSSNVNKAGEFGITPDRVFPMWDWVGGRYSLWSAIGLPIMFLLGPESFDDLLQGAQDMDRHFQQADFKNNLPVLMALLGVWYNNFFGAETHAILPYSHSLRYFPSHLQQLDMESNGKSVSKNGEQIHYQSGAIIWGGAGTNGQHAYHQLIHQGTRLIPADFIVAMKSQYQVGRHHTHLISNCLSQAQAMMQGINIEEVLAELGAAGLSLEKATALAPHKVIRGNQPSNMLVLETLSPAALGALIALYEHKVFVQGVIWNVNSFDQWGVELGKAMSSKLTSALEDDHVNPECDSSTAQLIKRFHTAQTSN